MAKNYKTIALTGTEQKVVLAGQNCDIRNDSVDVVYASAEAGITSGADGVLSIPAGQAAKLLDCRGTLYILGTGSVMLCGNDYSELVFKTAATSSGEGGGTVDDVARQAISSHANNEDIHLTAEKAIEAAATVISNPNLLINPLLDINQRGQEEYTQRNAYTVDGWMLHASVGNVFNAAAKTLTFPQSDTAAWYGIIQPVEYDLAGETVTVSANVETDVDVYVRVTHGTSASREFYKLIPAGFSGIVSLTADIPDTATSPFSVQFTNRNEPTAGGTVKPGWVKLEFGSVATPFIPPDPAMELVKCQRYYQVRSTGDINPVDLRPSMRTITDVRERSDGNYEYIAEL